MKRLTSAVIVLAAEFLAAQSFVLGQTKPITITVNDARPLAAALPQLERLARTPVNYEDVRTDFVGDQKDITEGNVTPAQNALAIQNGLGPVQLIAPIGGSLETTIAVDAASGTLPNAASATNALNELLLAYKAASQLPGAFRLELHNGAFFVEPIEIRNEKGKTVAATPVLATPITLSVVQRNAGETLNIILAEVLRSTGFKIGVGMVPMNALAMTRVTIDAVQTPASQVLAEFMNRLLGYGKVAPALSPSFAYRVLYDPQLKYYMFNIVEVGVAPLQFATPQQTPPPSLSPWFTRAKP